MSRVVLHAIPFSASLAAHLALREAKADVEVAWMSLDPATEARRAFLQINAAGRAPAVTFADGSVVTETLAVLWAIMRRWPDAFRPLDTPDAEIRELERMTYLATELHKKCLNPYFAVGTAEPIKRHAFEALPATVQLLEQRFAAADVMPNDRISPADAYGFSTLVLARHAGIDLEPYPTLSRFMATMGTRPAVRQTIEQEREALARQRTAAT